MIIRRSSCRARDPNGLLHIFRGQVHAPIQRYAALLPDMRHPDVERELVDLAAMLGVD